jgi:hypothetical protein
MNGDASLEGAHAVDPHVRVPTLEDHEVFTGNQRIQNELYDSGCNYGRNHAQVDQEVGVSRAFAHRVSNRDGSLREPAPDQRAVQDGAQSQIDARKVH